jgi:predicted Fe-Mo cluster-binding NifX family protein
MAQGAGIQTAELMTRHDVGVVLTGYVGPKAFQALSAAGIKIGQNLEDLSVRQAVEKYKTGQVPMAESPNRGGGGQR